MGMRPFQTDLRCSRIVPMLCLSLYSRETTSRCTPMMVRAYSTLATYAEIRCEVNAWELG